MIENYKKEIQDIIYNTICAIKTSISLSAKKAGFPFTIQFVLLKLHCQLLILEIQDNLQYNLCY